MAKKRILIVDDEQDFTRMIQLNLEKTGQYEVKTENMGSNALSAARQFKPDLVLLDIIMPDMDGGEVASQIRSDEQLKNVPIVFLTAIVTEGEVDSQSGFISGYPFIAKPIGVEKLIAAIEEYIVRN